jgi:hypothetical protein
MPQYPGSKLLLFQVKYTANVRAHRTQITFATQPTNLNVPVQRGCYASDVTIVRQHLLEESKTRLHLEIFGCVLPDDLAQP